AGRRWSWPGRRSTPTWSSTSRRPASRSRSALPLIVVLTLGVRRLPHAEREDYDPPPPHPLRQPGRPAAGAKRAGHRPRRGDASSPAVARCPALPVGPRSLVGPAALHRERLPGHLLPGLLLLVGQDGVDLLHRLLAQGGELLAVPLGVAPLVEFARLLGGVVVDRLDLLLLVVLEGEFLLDLSPSERPGPGLLQLDLLQPLDLLRLQDVAG